MDAWAAAHELESLSLADALALCLVLVDDDSSRFDRCAVRWVGRLASEPRGLDLAGLLLAASSLAGLRDSTPDAPIAALGALLDRRGDRDARAALEAWVCHRR